MIATKILEPLTPNESLIHFATKIFQNLKALNTNANITFQEFLKSLQMTEAMYILSLRSQLTKPHIFLKRKPVDIKTNAFGINVAPIWFANTDAQFVLDPYAAASYCTSYMTKIDKTISKELYKIIQHCIAEKTEANIRIQKLGNAFLNAQQMSAQLAAYLVLSLPLHHASRSFKFINTSPLEERAFVLKPQTVLNQLEDDSTDIMCSSIIDKYIDRPKNLDALSLVEFVSYYNVMKKKNSKRLRPLIIRYVNFNKHKDHENWSREQLLLFSPFRHSESSQLGLYSAWQDAYEEKKK